MSYYVSLWNLYSQRDLCFYFLLKLFLVYFIFLIEKIIQYIQIGFLSPNSHLLWNLPYLSTHPTLCPFFLFKKQTKIKQKNQETYTHSHTNTIIKSYKIIQAKDTNKTINAQTKQYEIKQPTKILLSSFYVGQLYLGMGMEPTLK